MLSTRRIISAIPKRTVYGMQILQYSYEVNQDAGHKFREYRALKNMGVALAKNIKSTKKKITNDPENDRLTELTRTLQNRGFEVDNETCPKVLYLSKEMDTGENIVISIWKEVVYLFLISRAYTNVLYSLQNKIIEVHAMIDKPSIESYSLTFRCACNKSLLGLYAVEVIPASVGDDHTKIYGSRPMPLLKDDIKVKVNLWTFVVCNVV